jgi:hypothetical protein
MINRSIPCYEDNIPWGISIADMTTKILAHSIVGTGTPAQDTRTGERDETVMQNGGFLEALQHVGVMQGGEAEKHHLQQQPKPKHKLQLKDHSVQQHEPNQNISKMYFSHWKPPGVSERMWSVNLDASISGEYQTLGGHSCRLSG